MIVTIALSVPILLIAFPLSSPQKTAEKAPLYKKFGMLKWEDGEEHEMPQDFADMLGWKELAAKVDVTYKKIPSAENTLILCDN